MIGSWLIKELLAAEATVVAFVLDLDPRSELVRSSDIQKVNVINGDLENFLTLERAINVHAVDTVFHLGAQTLVEAAHRFPLGTWEANVRGTYNVLEACRVHGDFVRCVVIASSDKAYGESGSLPYTEETEIAARHPYEVSKACGDLIARSYHHTYGVPVTMARCGNVYGGGDLNWSRIVPGTIRALLREEQPVIRSDGTYVRDYIYVRDAARAYMQLAERAHEDGVRGEVFNFGLESPLTVVELVEAIKRLMDRQAVELVIEARAVGEISAQYLSAKKAHERLDWSPQYGLDAGLSETIDWYRTFLG